MDNANPTNYFKQGDNDKIWNEISNKQWNDIRKVRHYMKDCYFKDKDIKDRSTLCLNIKHNDDSFVYNLDSKFF
jgi:hypothetical protein